MRPIQDRRQILLRHQWMREYVRRFGEGKIWVRKLNSTVKFDNQTMPKATLRAILSHKPARQRHFFKVSRVFSNHILMTTLTSSHWTQSSLTLRLCSSAVERRAENSARRCRHSAISRSISAIPLEDVCRRTSAREASSWRMEMGFELQRGPWLSPWLSPWLVQSACHLNPFSSDAYMGFKTLTYHTHG